MRKRLWNWFIKKVEKPLTAISIGVTILLIFSLTVNAIIKSGEIANELYGTKKITITNARADDGITIIDTEIKRGSEQISRVDETVEEKIKKIFPDDYEIALAVAKAESGLNKLAVNENTNGSKDRGLFQINSCHGYGDELFNEDTNIEVARKLYEQSGWSPWVAFNNGSYKEHLN